MKTRLIILSTLLLLIGCMEKESFDVLEPNKWETESIPNPFELDSVVTTVMNPSICSIDVFLSFDKDAFEAEWTDVTHVSVICYKIKGVRNTPAITFSKKVTGDKIHLRPDYTYTLLTYRFKVYPILENGRVAKPLSFNVKTPEYGS